MSLTPMDIEKQEFEIRMRGFDRAQVKGFLSAVAEETARLTAERNLLEEEATGLKKRIEEFEAREKKVQETILALRDLSEKMKDDARREADLIIREARLKSEKLLEEARSEALRIEAQISQLGLDRDRFEDRLRMLLEEHQRLLSQRHDTETPAMASGRRKRGTELEQ